MSLLRRLMGVPQLLAISRPKRQRFARYIFGVLITFFFVSTYRSYSGRSSHKIQYAGFKRYPSHYTAQSDRQKAVRKEFLHAWWGYKDHSWMADSLMSLSGQRKDQFCGWSATLVDTLDTLWIMDLKEEFNEAVEATLTIDFVPAAEYCKINLFESTIRYLGGMLAAYDLSGDKRLLPKLTELGEILYGQFHTTNGMPCSYCYLIPGNETRELYEINTPLADAGSFSLEFARLSQITGDPRYLNLVIFLTEVFSTTQHTSSIPGLWPERVDVTSVHEPSPEFATKSFSYSLGALSDSAYEYLVKSHLLLGGLTHQFAFMWSKAARSIRKNLLFRAMFPQSNVTDAIFSGIATHYAESEDLMFEPRIQHLGCFAGGMFAMSGKLFNNPADIELGRQLTEGCVWAYENGPLGIMPETVTLLNCPDFDGKQCQWNQTAWDQNEALNSTYLFGWYSVNESYPLGFVSSIDTKYLLRPEAIESVFVMYRITGDEHWRDVGWKMFQNIIKHTRTPYGHASLQDVMRLGEQTIYNTRGGYTTIEKALQSDEMESFWLAETLKYFWLLFSEPDRISLDEWVLNTEAHPLRLTKGIRAA